LAERISPLKLDTLRRRRACRKARQTFAYPQPRVWRHEVEWQAVWIVELTV
jgi:hypothetical protein